MANVIKRALGKLSAPNNLQATVMGNGFEPLPITIAHATKVGEFWVQVTRLSPVTNPLKDFGQAGRGDRAGDFGDS